MLRQRLAILVISLALCCLCPSTPAADPGLLARFPMAEGAGTVIRDATGSGVTGTLHNVDWARRGRVTGLQLRRTDSYVELSPGLKEKIVGDFTLTAWVVLTAAPFPDPDTNWVILDCESYDGKPLPQRGFILRIAGDSAKPYFRTCQPGAIQDSTLGWPLANRRPYLVGVVKRGTAARLVLNGLPGPEFAVTEPEPSPTPVRLGGVGQSLNGILGEVRVYNRALSEEELTRLYRSAAADWACGEASTSPGADTNIGLAENGCWVIASSNANWTDLYSSNLIDGDADTFWQSFQPTREEWVELRWDFPMAVNRVAVLPHADSRATELELLAWVRDQWQRVAGKDLRGQAVAEGRVEFQFPTLRTQRLRLVCRNDAPCRTTWREVQAFGPAQPLLYVDLGDDWRTGKWAYFPTSRREVVATSYRALSVGRQSSPYEGAAESVVVEEATVTPEHPEPGHDARLTLKLKPVARLADDYALTATVGERELVAQYADYTVARDILVPGTPPSQWAAGQTQTVTADLHLPVWAPHGASNVMLHAVSPAGRPPLRFVDRAGRELDDGRVAIVDIRRFARPPAADARPHTARVVAGNGTLIALDGRTVAPAIFALQAPSFEQFHYYAQGDGVKVLGLPCYPWAIHAGDYQQRNFEYLARHVQNALRVAPDVYVLVFVDLRTRPDWRKAHPDACLTTHDGQRLEAESYCAKEFRDEATRYVTNLVRFVQAQPWGNHVIGYDLCTGAEGIMGDYGMSSRSGIGDYNPQAIAAFQEFVRQRYGGDIGRLRTAYNDPQITFETAFPAHAKIMEPGADGGSFLEPRTQRLTSDYYEFLSSLVPTFTEELAATIKRLSGGRVLVGTYGAYLLEALAVGPDLHQANHCYTYWLAQAPDLDFFASPHNYLDFVRQAGGPYRPYQPLAALRLNGKLHVSEADVRTFRSGMRNGYTHRSREETLSVLTRDLGTGLMHGMGAWLADWGCREYKDRSQREPFFVDDQILAHIALLRRRYEETLGLRRGIDAEVAVFLSGPAAWYMDNSTDRNALAATLCLGQVFYSLTKAGLPCDELLLEDVVKPEVQAAYKCCIFLNAFYLTDAQTQAIEKLKRGGRTLVWLYAPGYVRDTGLSAKSVEAVTGLGVGVDPAPQTLAYRLPDRTHPITAGLEDKEYYGDRRPVAPRFCVTTPDATVLGVYADGKAAVALKDFGTHRSFYSAVPALPFPLLKNLLRYAGCHVYVNDEIYMDATKDFLLLTNSFDGPRTVAVSLPRPRDVSDLLTGRQVATGVTRFEAPMAPGETVLYRLR